MQHFPTIIFYPFWSNQIPHSALIIQNCKTSVSIMKKNFVEQETTLLPRQKSFYDDKQAFSQLKRTL